MRIGIAFDLKQDFTVPEGRDDLLEEYDSVETVEAIAEQIERLGHEAVLLHGGRKFIENLLRQNVDLVFNIAEGVGGRSREAQVPAVCEMLGVPYTHSDAMTLSICLDKHMTLKLAQSSGIPTPLHYLIENPSDVENREFPLPAVLKPVHEGSSMGITRRSLVKSRESLYEEAKRLFDLYHQPVIVEEFLPGKELTVGILGNSPPRIIGVMEIAPRSGNYEDFLYSIETKRDYRRLVRYGCPPTGLSEETIAMAGKIALMAYSLFGCLDVARIDIRLDGKGVPKFLEINPLPGLSPVYSDLCIMASLVNLSYGNLIESIVVSALKRWGIANDKDKKRKKKRHTPYSSPRPEFERL